jgi:phage shock protein A
MPDMTQALVVIEQQIKELDAIAKGTNETLNAVAGRERVAKWKARAAAALAQQVNQQEAQAFSRTSPGPSFTNDLVDEFNDEVDFYRTQLTALRARVQKLGPG